MLALIVKGTPDFEPDTKHSYSNSGYLVLGFVIYGALWGLLFGLVAYGIQTSRPAAWTTARFGFTLALLVGWSVAMLPFLKYPANPPGVGEASTIAYRQGLYLGFLGLAGAGTVVAVGVYHWLKRWAQHGTTGRMHTAMAVIDGTSPRRQHLRYGPAAQAAG